MLFFQWPVTRLKMYKISIANLSMHVNNIDKNYLKTLKHVLSFICLLHYNSNVKTVNSGKVSIIYSVRNKNVPERTKTGSQPAGRGIMTMAMTRLWVGGTGRHLREKVCSYFGRSIYTN